MAISFLNLEQKLDTIRPIGYQYPIGLSQRPSGNTFETTTGGTKTVDSTNGDHSFTVSGTFVPSFTGTVEALIVAGGGGGGQDSGGAVS